MARVKRWYSLKNKLLKRNWNSVLFSLKLLLPIRLRGQLISILTIKSTSIKKKMIKLRKWDHCLKQPRKRKIFSGQMQCSIGTSLQLLDKSTKCMIGCMNNPKIRKNQIWYREKRVVKHLKQILLRRAKGSKAFQGEAQLKKVTKVKLLNPQQIIWWVNSFIK